MLILHQLQKDDLIKTLLDYTGVQTTFSFQTTPRKGKERADNVTTKLKQTTLDGFARGKKMTTQKDRLREVVMSKLGVLNNSLCFLMLANHTNKALLSA